MMHILKAYSVGALVALIPCIAFAQPRDLCGVNVDVAVETAASGTPANIQAFLGIWGPGQWPEDGRCNALLIKGVNADGTAKVTYIYGARTLGTASGVNASTGSFEAVGQIAGRSMKFKSQMGVAVEYQMQSNGELRGWFGPTNKPITLKKQ